MRVKFSSLFLLASPCLVAAAEEQRRILNSPYQQIPAGNSACDPGFEITTIDECETAGVAVGGKLRNGAAITADWGHTPCGCLLYLHWSGNVVHFDSGTTNCVSNTGFAPVCKKPTTPNKENWLSLGPSPMLPMTEDKLKLVYHAARLSDLAYFPVHFPTPCTDDIDRGIEIDHVNQTPCKVRSDSNMTYYQREDNLDALITEDKGGYCFVSFRGTLMKTWDWIGQNFDLGVVDAGPRSSGAKCKVQKGFHEAYAGHGRGKRTDAAIFPSIIDMFINTCMAKPDKTLVFTGHSQGGAAAGVAHAIYSDWDPLTITFGQPPFLARTSGDSCPLINENHFWRFINSESDSDKKMQYDLVPNLNSLDHSWWSWLIKVPAVFVGLDFDYWSNMIGPHVGSTMIFPPGDHNGDLENSQNAVVYHGPDEPEMIPRSGALDIYDFQEEKLSAHKVATYVKKVRFLIDNLNGAELDVGGFHDGSLCYFDKDCDSGRCDLDSYLPFSGRSCKGKVGSSQKCNEHDDCGSGSCTVGGGACISPVMCCNKAKQSVNEGGVCYRAEDCVTGRCDKVTSLGTKTTCQAKLGRSHRCSEHSDCISNSCTTAGGSCLAPQWCCEAPPATRDNGQVCETDRECKSRRCDCEGVFCTRSLCKAKLPRGQSCNEHDDCSSGSCKYGAAGCWGSCCN